VRQQAKVIAGFKKPTPLEDAEVVIKSKATYPNPSMH
jgi:hypothetical protein